jgi:hypothetical protein
MPTSKKAIQVAISVRNTRRFMQLYGNRIGPGKEFETKSEALNDMLEKLFNIFQVGQGTLE